MHWYYEKNGVSCGPHDDAEMAHLLLESKLTADALIWRPGMSEWQSLRELNPGWLRTPPAPPKAATPSPQPPEAPLSETPTKPLPTEAPVVPKLRPHAPSPEPEAEKPGLLKRLFGFGKKK